MDGFSVRLPRDQLSLAGASLLVSHTRRRDWPSWTGREVALARSSGTAETESQKGRAERLFHPWSSLRHRKGKQ